MGIVIVQTMKQMSEFLFDYLIHSPIWSYDCETHNEISDDNTFINDYYKDVICGHAIGDDKESIYVPVRHLRYDSNYKNLRERKEAAELICKFAGEHNGILVNHNIKFDFHRFRLEGIKPSLHDCVDWDRVVDTEGYARAILPIVSPMYRETGKGAAKVSYRLKHLAPMFLNQEITGENLRKEYLKSQGIPIISYAKYPIDVLGAYAGEDPKLAVMLYKYLVDIIKDMPDMQTYLKFERKFMRVIFDIEKTGMPIDTAKAEELREGLLEKIASDREVIHEMLGDINYNSPKQVADILLSKGFKLDITEKGNYSVGKKSLSKIRHPFAKAFINHSSDVHTVNTYLKVMGKYPSLHGTLNQFGTGSGRISSKEPNLQNIPTRAGNVRAIVVPPEGHYIALIDWASMEVVMSAIRSKDRVLTAEINNGEDLHVNSAVTCFQKDKKVITKAERSVGKTMNFRIQYGSGGGGVYEALTELAHENNRNIMWKLIDEYDEDSVEKYIEEFPDSGLLRLYSEGDCYGFVNGYWNKYQGADRYKKSLQEILKKRGYITLGVLPKRNYCRSPHMSYNSDIQGTSGMYSKHRTYLAWEFIKNIGAKTRIVNLVHDETFLIIPFSEVGMEYAVAEFMIDRTTNPKMAVSIAVSTKSWKDKIIVCPRYI